MSIDQKYLEHLFLSKYKGKNINLCRDTMEDFADTVIKVLFPALCNKVVADANELNKSFDHLEKLLNIIVDCLKNELHASCRNEAIIKEFFAALPELEMKMNKDAEFILSGDPAAKSIDEVVICYPGFYAICIYRLAHFFYGCKLPLFPRIIAEYAHRKTGIDIHPGASIQSPFFIDHGTGVVIGESTIIGKRVKIYQGVTLGAKSVRKELANTKRHPTIEDDCVIYANATILGGDTIIGKDSVIGGSMWVIESVPPLSRLFYKT